MWIVNKSIVFLTLREAMDWCYKSGLLSAQIVKVPEC